MSSTLDLFDLYSVEGNYFAVVCILLLATLFGIYYNEKKKQHVQLPEPRGLPIVGYLPFLGKRPEETLFQLTKKYGPVFRIQLGALPCLVLGNYEAIKEAFIKQSVIFSGRPNEISFKIYNDEPAFIFDEGPAFKHVRMFSLDLLKKLGFGRLSLEPLVKKEVELLVEDIRKIGGKPLDFTTIIERSVGNAICSIICGKRCEVNDPWLTDLINAVNGLQETYIHDYAFFFPWMKIIPIIKNFTSEKKKIFWKEEAFRVWKLKIAEIKKEFDEGLLPNNFISSWFKEREEKKAKNDSFANLYSDYSLISNLDIFAQASFETTSTSLMWAICYFIQHPEWVEKIRQEFDKLDESKKSHLSFVDSKFMPITRAVIQEIHRLASILPFGVFRRTLENTVLMGYDVPKGILVMSNLYAAHKDPEFFPEPEKFKPQRFLTDDGQYIRDERVIPFSVGKRFCPGEFVAQMEIFHYITQLLLNFDLKLGPNSEKFGQCTNNTLIIHPLPFEMCFIPRSE